MEIPPQHPPKKNKQAIEPVVKEKPLPVDELFTIEQLDESIAEDHISSAKAFDKIPHVSTSEELLDIAFRRASAGADKARGKKISHSRIARSREIEKIRISITQSVLHDRLDRIFESFPDIRSMSLFYQDLSRALVDMEQFKRSLAAIRFAQRKIQEFWRYYTFKITKTQSMESINPYRKEYYGRIASVIKQIKTNLKFLESSRRTFKQFPVIDETLPTVAIVGFPNVGKTTLLFKLTGSKPDIAPYAFTTKNINVSMFTSQGKTIQVLDTPGSLNRFEKMNAIEKQAVLAMKHLAHQLVYVFDPLESYPLEDQEKLFKELPRFEKPILVYISKEDISDKELIFSLEKKFSGDHQFELLQAKILKYFNSNSYPHKGIRTRGLVPKYI